MHARGIDSEIYAKHIAYLGFLCEYQLVPASVYFRFEVLEIIEKLYLKTICFSGKNW